MSRTILLVVLLVDAALLAVSYRLAYRRSYANCESRLRNASVMVTELVEYFQTYEEGDQAATISDSFTHYCEHLDLPYIYAFEVDKEKSTIHYVAIGFGEEATETAKKELYPGAVCKITMSEELLSVYEGKESSAIEQVKNEYGQTMIYYTAIRRVYNRTTGTYEQVSKNPLMIGLDISFSSVMHELGRSFRIMSILLVTLSLLLVFSVGFIVYRRVSIPARMISSRMSSFVEDYDRGIQPLPVKGEDEFSEMSRSFNTMAGNIHSYIDSIGQLSKEKHIRQTELDIAGDIQLGLLRAPHFETDSFRINAKMRPAKNVGGDLYAYQVLENGKIFITVADVSGKGISASLFMSRAVTLLQQYAKMNYSPAKILQEYNDNLSGQNSGGLFITTFVALYDPITRELSYANGGHNIPYLLSDRLIPLDGARGLAAGVFPGEEFEEEKVALKKGDTVFLYTDGVNEAVSKDNTQYSNERLEEMLTGCLGKEDANPVEVVQKDLKHFTDGAEQSDDITLLSLTICTEDIVLHLKADEKQLARVKEAVLSLPLDEDMHKKLYLAAEEIYVNICAYAYDRMGDVEVKIAMKDAVEMTFIDGGRPFNPTEDVQDLDDYDYDTRIGGLGRFITFNMADDYRYEYKDEKNYLWLRFELSDEEAATDSDN